MAITLVLMRHGKAQRPRDGQSDFDRELSEAGTRSLAASLPGMLAPLAAAPPRVEVLSSPAVRAMQTASLLEGALSAIGCELGFSAVPSDALWTQDGEAFIAQLAECEADVVFAVGHNPFIEDVTCQLTGAVLPCSPGALVALALDYDAGFGSVHDSGAGVADGPNTPAARLLWFAQGPLSQNWKTLVKLEEVLREGAATVRMRHAAFLENPEDIETLHKFRVSIRTLRSLIAFVRPWQSTKQNARAQVLLKDVVALTSRQRELDVFAEQARNAPGSSEALVEFCDAEAAAERERVYAALASKPIAKKLAAVAELMQSVQWKAPYLKAGLAQDAVRARFDAMVDALGKDMRELDLADVELTHDVRKRAKRVRYSAENFTDIVGDDAIGIAKGMTAHQDNLGAICDARVNIDMINGFLGRELPDAVAWDLTLLRAQNETFLFSTLKSAR